MRATNLLNNKEDLLKSDKSNQSLKEWIKIQLE